MFEPNEYFTNPILTKEYFIRFTVEDDNPLGYEGPDIVRCTGSVTAISVSSIAMHRPEIHHHCHNSHLILMLVNCFL